jgi:hypothetical protein
MRLYGMMHFRFLVTVNRDRVQPTLFYTQEHVDTSAEARRYVYGYLLTHGFAEAGRWSRGLADWFVIGGRWSGELSRHSWARALCVDGRGGAQRRRAGVGRMVC